MLGSGMLGRMEKLSGELWGLHSHQGIAPFPIIAFETFKNFKFLLVC